MKARVLLALATRFGFNTGDPVFPVTVERTGSIDAGYQFDPWADVWAVRWKGWCLDIDGTWIHEPLPSARDAEFYARTRWPRDEAIERAAVAAVLRQRIHDQFAASTGTGER